jgi:glyoxylase-like metal-dependent hydrolase (beta-lactamase superfamily II)
MAASRRWARWVLLLLLLLPVAFVLFVRGGTHWGPPPALVHGSVWRAHTMAVDFYGARVGDGVVLFDSGADAQGRKLDELLAALGKGRDDVGDVFITHGHPDHTAAAPLCKKARLHGGIGDSDMMSGRAPIQPGMPRFMGRVLGAPKVMLTDAFIDSSTVTAGGADVRAVRFPGHTPGTMLYVYDGVLFAGDTMDYKDGKLTWLKPTLFNYDDAQLHRNMAGLASVIDVPSIKVVCTGHGGCTPEADTQRLLADFIQAAQK